MFVQNQLIELLAIGLTRDPASVVVSYVFGRKCWISRVGSDELIALFPE